MFLCIEKLNKKTKFGKIEFEVSKPPTKKGKRDYLNPFVIYAVFHNIII
jgi:hypothetical protein